jgi:myo-inositol 2-dehydrogenase/D-chiro-inositol 1-dehydrogenase
MGQVHLAVLERLEGVEVAAVVDPVVAEATHRDVDELLADRRPEGAIVAAPSTLHLDVVSRLLDAGVPTLCEKPCGTTAAEARAAFDRAAATGTPLQIGYWRRFVPTLGALRARLAAGDFGETLLVRCEQWDERPPPASFRAASGGILVDMGVHEFDQLRWLTGNDVADVVAFAAGPDADSATVHAELDDGTAAIVSLGRVFPHGDCCWVEVMGTAGHARELFMWGDAGLRVFADALVAQAEAFADAVRGERGRGATGEDAVRAIEAADRAGRSLAAARA